MVYTCPPGFRAVVRDIELVLVGGVQDVDVFTITWNNAITFWVHYAGGRHFDWAQWVGRLVLLEGETIQGQCTIPAHVYVSGYELAL